MVEMFDGMTEEELLALASESSDGSVLEALSSSFNGDILSALIMNDSTPPRVIYYLSHSWGEASVDILDVVWGLLESYGWELAADSAAFVSKYSRADAESVHMYVSSSDIDFFGEECDDE